MSATSLPHADVLIEAAREAMRKAHSTDPAKVQKAASKALDEWAPAIDQLADQAAAAEFLGYTGPGTIQRMKQRVRGDGTREWPEADERFGRSDVWRLRTIVLHKAAAPGRGHPGMTLGRGHRAGS